MNIQRSPMNLAGGWRSGVTGCTDCNSHHFPSWSRQFTLVRFAFMGVYSSRGSFSDLFLRVGGFRVQTDRAGCITSVTVLNKAATALQVRFPGGGFAKKVCDMEKIVVGTIQGEEWAN